jgi:hypothetical protein
MTDTCQGFAVVLSPVKDQVKNKGFPVGGPLS